MFKLDIDLFYLYNNTFSYKNSIGIDEGTGKPRVYGKLYDYDPPEDETREKFIDRIERSKKAKRNLFLEEWVKAKPLPKGVLI